MDGIDDRIVAITASCPVLVQRRRCHDRMRRGVSYAVLVAIFVCALTACEEEDYTTTYRVLSPSGAAVALKTYSQLSPFKYTISIQKGADQTNLQSTPVMTGLVPGGSLGADATLMSWRGDESLDVLIPIGGQAAISRESVGSLSVRYDRYDPKSSLTGKRPEQAEDLKRVVYEVGQKSESKSINCSIAVQGIDPKSSRTVGVVLSGLGIDLRYLQGEFGTFSAKFFVSNLSVADRKSLTLTQAEIEGVPIFDEHLAPIVGPLQDSTTEEYISSAGIRLSGSSEYQLVNYGNLQRPVISAVFERISAGKLAIKYGFGGGDETATYKFDMPIDEKSVRAYQECEAKVRIFLHPVGSLLQANRRAKEE